MLEDYVSQNAQPLALSSNLGITNATRPRRIRHNWHLHSWSMKTNMRIPIDGIVSFSWYRIAEAASPIQLVEIRQE